MRSTAFHSISVNIPRDLLVRVDEEKVRSQRRDPTNPISRGHLLRTLIHEALLARGRVRAAKEAEIKKGYAP